MEEEPQIGHSNFDFGENIDRYLPVFQEAGFAQTKRWYQATNHVFRTGEDFLLKPIGPPVQDLEPVMKDAIKDTYDDLSGKNTPDLKVMEVMVILAFKD